MSKKIRASLIIITFTDSVLVLVGISILLYFGKNKSGQLHHNLYFVCVMCYIFLSFLLYLLFLWMKYFLLNPQY